MGGKMARGLDDVFELYVEAWTEYHKATEAIDGHIDAPRTKEEFQICARAAVAGRDAIEKFKRESIINALPFDKEKWFNANLEAMKRLGI